MKKINVDISFKDARGEIVDLIDHETIHAITKITFAKGAVRANHYHKETTQWNYVLAGKIRLVAQLPGEEAVEAIMLPGDFIATVPHERHALEALEESVLLVFTKGPRGGKEYESDTYRLDVPLIKQLEA